MSDLIEISDSNRISRFFRDLSKQKHYTVSIMYNQKLIVAEMFFSSRRPEQPNFRSTIEDIEWIPGEIIEVTFYNSEVGFQFTSEITTVFKDKCTVAKPKNIFTSFKRLMPRHRVIEDEMIFFECSGNTAKNRISDISLKGVSVISERADFEIGQILENVSITFNENKQIFKSGVVMNTKKLKNGTFIFGISLDINDLKDRNIISDYILNKIYPELIHLEDASNEDIYSIYQKSGFLSIIGINEDGYFDFSVNTLDSLRKIYKRHLISSGLLFYKNGKPMSMGSVFRIYNDSFIGHQVISTTEAQLESKPISDVNSGMCDFLLTHPDFKYFISYQIVDMIRQQEYYMSIEGIIRDNNKFIFDILQFFEYDRTRKNDTHNPLGYICKTEENPEPFFEYCKNSLEPLETKSYDYTTENFALNDVKKAFNKKGLFIERQLFGIYKSDEIVAYALAECFSDGINLLSSVDICRVFLVDGTEDIRHVLNSLIKPVDAFYDKHGKSKFYVALKTREKTAEDVVISGLEYKFPAGRVIADREGLTEYKKLITGNIVYTPRYYKLSRPQISIWNTEKMYPNTNIGNIAGTIIITEKIDFQILEKAINMVLQYNNGLRLRITEEDGQPQQYISKYNYSKIDHFDFSLQGEMEGLCKWDEYRGLKGFNLIDSDLFYFATFKINDNESGFYIRVHHIISDAWTIMNILTGTVIDFYKHLKNGSIPDHIPSSYLDYVFSEEVYENSENFLEHREFWKEHFKTVPDLTSIKQHSKGYKCTSAKRKTFVISQELTSDMLGFCKETGNSPFAVFMAAISMYINRITGKKDMVIGTPILNRSSQREKEIAGMFVGVVPLRLFVEPKMTFTEYLNSVSEELKKALKNQKYPYDLILKDFREMHGTNENLFDVAVSFQNISLQNLGVEYHTEWIFNGHQTESLLLHISDREGSQTFTMDLDYQVDLFEEYEIEEIFSHMMNLLTAGVRAPKVEICGLEMLSEQERNMILYQFNDTKTDYPRDKTIHQLFEEQVEKTPDNIAVVHDGKHLTYRELNSRANSLARVLREKGAGPDSIVGIIVDRSFEMVIGFLAILKAGGAYLPIDCKYPAERIQFMMEDSNIKILITKKRFSVLVNNFYSNETIFFEDYENSENKVNNQQNINSANDLAYIMYTSGSTGNPKGAMIEHRNVVRLVKNTNYIEFEENDRMVQTGSIVFDASTFEIWGALLNGLELFLVDENAFLNADKFESILKDNRITILFLTTALFNLFVQQKPEMFKNLTSLFVGGEILSPKHMNLVRKICKDTKVFNIYGPTENTTFSTYYSIDEDYVEDIPIGRSISNSTSYILDENDYIQPIGVPGELCVGGDGVGRGYLNRRDLTEAKFKQNPFVPGERIYRTGDNAKWQSDGNIIFLGRVDNQIKIRGFRVELGEIESCLLTLDSIRETIVIAKQDSMGDKYLCAYIVSDYKIDINELKKKLRTHLAEFMIPSHVIQIDKMPLNSNGKIDKKALPELIHKKRDKNKISDYNNMQINLVDIISEILEMESIDIDDDFFEIGGDSLKGITLISKIKKVLNVELPIQKLFDLRTVKQMAEFIDLSKREVQIDIASVEEREFYEVSSAQKRMYLLQHFDEENICYNIPGSLIIEGNLDKSKLAFAIKKLVSRHESLRTSFELIDNNVVQIIQKEINFELECISASEADIEAIAKDFIKPFSLAKYPLFRTKLVALSQTKHILMMDLHHIIFDGVSLGVVVKDLAAFYQDVNPEPLRIQYKDFSAWQNTILKSEEFKKKENYWLEQFSDGIPVLNMPLDFSRPPVQSFEGDRIFFETDKDLTRELNALASKNGVTLFMLLLAAYNVLLMRYTAQEDFIVGVPIAGRTHSDLENMVGMFVNTLAMRNKPQGDKSFEKFIMDVKQNALNAYANQEYQFEELVEKLNVKRDMGRNPIFDTMFVLQSMNTSQIEMENIKITVKPLDFKISKFDFTLQAQEAEGKIKFDLEYCTKLFEKQTMGRFAGHFKNLLTDIAQNSDKKLSEYEIMSEDEKNQILVDFNNTKTDYPKDKTIHQLFEEQVEKTPDNIAVVFEDSTMTYRQLNEKANQIAWILREKGVKPESIVGIMIDRSFEMVIGFLAILKAGGAYLPIDSKYPADRIKFMLEDCDTNILLTKKTYEQLVSGFYKNQILFFEDCENLEICIDNNLNLNKPNNLAYIMYTSGSTGNPKGTMIEHKNVVRLVKSTNYVEFNENDRILQTGAVVFDASTFEIWGSILNGLCLYLVDDSVILNADKLAETLKKNQISTIWLTSPLFNQLSQQNPRMFVGVKNLLVGGDVLSPKYINSVRKNCPGINIINGYGPTENTTFSTCFLIDQEYEEDIPIGKPISNSTAFILDQNDNLQPIGVPGELCVGGDGVGRGYLKRQELTDEKFRKNPFVPNDRIYRTGDKAKWRQDGSVIFLGRLDNQVKIRGYRVELGEIESKLNSVDYIKEAIVIVKQNKNKDKYLCAYVVADNAVDFLSLRKSLKENLAEYMIPSRYMQLKKMPLNQNGKIDRYGLPEVTEEIYININYEKPTNKIEEIMSKIWEEVLDINNVGTNDNFFELGGDSLLVMRVLAQTFAFNWKITMQDFYTNKTLKDLCQKVILNIRKNGESGIPKLDLININKLIRQYSSIYAKKIKTETSFINRCDRFSGNTYS